MINVGNVQIAMVKNMFGNIEVQAITKNEITNGIIYDKYQKNIIWKTPKKIPESVDKVAYGRAMKLYI